MTSDDIGKIEAHWEWLEASQQYLYSEGLITATIAVGEREWVLEIEVSSLYASGDVRIAGQDAGELKVLGFNLVQQFLKAEKKKGWQK